MIECYKTATAGSIERIEAPESGCWVNAIAPTPEERTWLEPTGDGSFAPLQYPAQTFYYSRQLAESLPAPMLEIQALNRSIAVFFR